MGVQVPPPTPSNRLLLLVLRSPRSLRHDCVAPEAQGGTRCRAVAHGRRRDEGCTRSACRSLLVAGGVGRIRVLPAPLSPCVALDGQHDHPRTVATAGSCCFQSEHARGARQLTHGRVRRATAVGDQNPPTASRANTPDRRLPWTYGAGDPTNRSLSRRRRNAPPSSGRWRAARRPVRRRRSAGARARRCSR